MADPSTPTPPQSEDQSQSSTQPKCRRATRLKGLTVSRNADKKLSIQFDMSTGKVIGDNRVRFTSFVALLGKSKVSILIDKWDHVPEELTYDVPNNNLLRRKWISYAGQRWRGFKIDLTSRYIYGKLSDKNPCEISKFLDEKTWLEEIMISEASSLATGDQSDLDNLVEKSSQGSFTQEGRDDILAVAIGRPEHPRYIRGVGRGVGLKQFFGGPTRKVTLSQLSESDKKKELFPKLRDELLAKIKSEMASTGLAIQVPPKGLPICPLPEESGDDVDVPVDCELYVDDPHLHLVALDIKDSSARVPLPSEEVQTVGQALGNFIIWPARLAKPILVNISKKTNIVTPPQPQLSALQQLAAAVVTMGNKTIEVDMPPELTCKNATTTLFVCHRDICEIVIGNDLLSTTVLQLWNLYLHHLCIERRNATIYGFLDPVIIQSVGNKSEEVQKYLIEMFEKAGKEVFGSSFKVAGCSICF
ncbi:hypothetical protein V8G54_017789 [Vigna mungo]|uniref:Uncharacterized protein n=1 Tax=Vigna mungo TaxID=3915 RepID=A0AAQ3NMV0_VIGMU